ncbi:Ser/Thr protein kinase RdoA (MazF antagonist) [Nesterenkonia lutea]|uniref:Ser/Thr protein kinase RdoA (MazF antagonist) n=1 Tax=Nesterenkonia lutea TaxID=272919 RepID=A0ABR9JI06_9MICC|nr:phosphotransferase [Nesterenkonia lutea]MBE1525147.1 Ser/Thr protein kinase RdoA (MazF antagonist) [Nesterenkonia lutea]
MPAAEDLNPWHSEIGTQPSLHLDEEIALHNEPIATESTQTMASAAEPFIAFASLHRGEPAPDWLSRQIISAWGLDPARTVLSLIAVSENATFRIEVDGAPYAVLRVHRPSYVDSLQIRSELQWVQALGEEIDVSVPEVVPLTDGSLVHTFQRGAQEGAAPEEEPWHVVAFAFVQGAVLEDIIGALPDPASYYRLIGEATAKFHQHADSWQRPVGFDRFQWRLEDMLWDSSRWGDWRAAEMSPQQQQTLESAEAAAVQHLNGLQPGDQGWGLIHADLRPSNIMMHEDSLTVIDFDDCGYGWYLYDFAAALSFIEHEPYTPQIAREWLAGYQGVRSLSARDLRHACALSMVRRLTMLGWTTTHRRDALPPAIWDAQLPGAVEVAQRYLDSPTWLVD